MMIDSLSSPWFIYDLIAQPVPHANGHIAYSFSNVWFDPEGFPSSGPTSLSTASQIIIFCRLTRLSAGLMWELRLGFCFYHLSDTGMSLMLLLLTGAPASRSHRHQHFHSIFMSSSFKSHFTKAMGLYTSIQPLEMPDALVGTKTNSNLGKFLRMESLYNVHFLLI